MVSCLGLQDGKRKQERGEYSRGSQAVESKKESHQPEDCVGDFDREFRCGEEKWEQAHMAGYC